MGGEYNPYKKDKRKGDVSYMGKFKTGCLGVIGVVVLLGVIGGLMGGGDKNAPSSSSTPAATEKQDKAQQPKQKVYNDADINVLLSEAKDNAAAANQNYKGKDVKITGGHVYNIDSDVHYITIDGSAAKYTMIHVRCDVNSSNKELKDSILKLKKEQPVTVYGTISDVGDIMGYTLKLDKIEPAQ